MQFYKTSSIKYILIKGEQNMFQFVYPTQKITKVDNISSKWIKNLDNIYLKWITKVDNISFKWRKLLPFFYF